MRRRTIFRSAVLGSTVVLAATLTPALPGSAVAAAAAAPACTTSAPVAALPVAKKTSLLKPTVSLTATDGHGGWAGVRYDGRYSFQVVSWRAGRTTVLDTLSYLNVSFDDLRSVRVVGMSAAGAVIVSAQATNRWYEAYVYGGLRYQNGHRYVLQSSPLWKSVEPTSVTPDGRVVGLARRTTSQDFTGQVVEWSATGVGAVRVLVAANARYPVLDGRGDMAYTYSDSQSQFGQARLADGRWYQLAAPASGPEGNVDILGGSGNYIYGESVAGLFRWDLSAVGSTPAGAALQPAVLPGLDGLVAAGPSRALVGSHSRTGQVYGTQYYRDVIGDLHPMPAGFVSNGQEPRPMAIAADGTVSFTDPTGQVRFFHCGVNPAAHNPRGGLDQAVDIAGTVQIQGAAADPDSLGSIWVQVYDTTGGRRTLLGQVLADQPSPGLDSALRITGNHGFNVVFRAGPGTRSFCVDALNTGPGNVVAVPLGCRTVLEHVGPLG